MDETLYQEVLDLTWYKIFIGIFVLFLLHHLFFAVLYFCGGPTSYTEFGTEWGFQFFLNCFFFSIQAGQTIGFGRWSPVSNWSNALVSIEVYLHLFQSSVVMTLLYAKFCRPTKITRQVVFSKNGCVSTRIRCFKDGASHAESDTAETQSCGHYVENSSRTPVLLFRFVNIRPVMLVGPSVELLLVRRGGKADAPFATVLHCECNWIHGNATQTHRTQPYLDLPVLVRHTVDESSPLHDCIFDVHEMERRGYEFILLVEYRARSSHSLCVQR